MSPFYALSTTKDVKNKTLSAFLVKGQTHIYIANMYFHSLPAANVYLPPPHFFAVGIKLARRKVEVPYIVVAPFIVGVPCQEHRPVVSYCYALDFVAAGRPALSNIRTTKRVRTSLGLLPRLTCGKHSLA